MSTASVLLQSCLYSPYFLKRSVSLSRHGAVVGAQISSEVSWLRPWMWCHAAGCCSQTNFATKCVGGNRSHCVTAYRMLGRLKHPTVNFSFLSTKGVPSFDSSRQRWSHRDYLDEEGLGPPVWHLCDVRAKGARRDFACSKSLLRKAENEGWERSLLQAVSSAQ